MRRGIIHLVAVLGILGLMTTGAQAAIVTLTVNFTPAANTATGTWRVFAQASTNDNAGIADFSIDVLGTAGITIATSTQNSPRITFNGDGDFAGFSQFRANGTPPGTGMGAAQDVLGFADPGQIVQGVGQQAFLADFASNGGASANIAFPIQLASGVYNNNGAGGLINAIVHPGGFIDVLNGTGKGTWVGPANVSAAQVVPGTVAIVVPEPASLALLSLGMLGALGRRRQA